MWEWLKTVLLWIWDVMVSACVWLFDLVTNLITWGGLFLDELWTRAYDFMAGLVPEGLITYVNDQSWWTSAQGYIDGIAWFLPVYTVMGIYVGAYSVQASIRLGRWILSIVPTVNLGG